MDMITAPGGIRAAPARDQLDQFIKKFVTLCPWRGECGCAFVYGIRFYFDDSIEWPNSMPQSVILCMKHWLIVIPSHYTKHQIWPTEYH